MADSKGIISSTIVVNTGDAEQKIRSLAGQLGALKKAYERAFTSDDKSTIFKKETVSVDDLQQRIVNITREISRMHTAMNQGTMKDSAINGAVKTLEGSEAAAKKATDAVKRWNQELQSAKATEKAKFDAEWASMKANYKPDRSVVNPDNIARLREQFAIRQRINDLNAKAVVDAEKLAMSQSRANSMALREQMTYQGYAQKLRDARLEAEILHQVMLKNNTAQSRLDFANAKAGLQGAVKASEEFSRSIDVGVNKIGYLGSFAQKLRSHFHWILAGSLLAAFAVIPNAIENIARETEVLGQKIKQNLELVDKYRQDHHALEADIKHLGEVAGVFAVGYGANVQDVMEMMQILSRRFKSPEELTYYTNLALTMHKLDFVTPKKAAEDLEAVILSMGLDFKGAKQFVDEFSVAVHTARVTGTDLLSGLQRSGAGFKNMNMGTAEAIALISTLSTVTAKAGANVGTSLSSLITNVDFKKGAEALKAYGIEVYDTTGKMRQGVEVWREMATAFNGLKVDDNDKKANELATALSGGKFRINDLKAILDNWHEFEKILTNIKTKASPELTTELLRTGMATYDTNVKQMNASLQILGITIGNELLPMLKATTIGLTEGVEWLNKHREEIAKVIEYIGLFAEALVLYRVQQVLATTALARFAGASTALASTAPSFNAAIRSMGSSMYSLGMTIGGALVKMAAFLAMAEIISRVSSGWSQESSEKAFSQSIAGAGSNDAGAGGRMSSEDQAIVDAMKARDEFRTNKAVATAFGGVMYKNGDDLYKANSLDNNIKDLIQTKEAKKGLDKVNAMVDLATKGMPGKEAATPYAPVTGQDIGGGGSDGSTGASAPSDHAEQLQRMQNQAEYRAILASIDIAEKKHEDTLKSISAQESIYGNTVGLTVEKLNANKDYIANLGTEYDSLDAMKSRYVAQLDEELATNTEISSVVSATLPRWSELTKEQQREQVKLNSELFQSFKTADALGKLISDIDSKQAGLHSKAEGIRAEDIKSTLGGTGDVMKQSNRRIQGIRDQESIDIAGATNKLDINNDVKLNEIKTKAIREQQVEFNAQIKYLEDELAEYKKQNLLKQAQDTEDALSKVKATYAKNAQEIKQLEYDKDSKIREGLYGITQDVLIQGNSLKSVWKNLWNQLANDSLKALFKIQNGSGGLLSSIIGLLGGGGRPSIGGVKVQGPLRPDGSFADGGIIDREMIARVGEGGKREAIIPLENNKSSARTLWAKTGEHLGMFKGTNVTANVSEKTMSIAKQASAAQQLATINAEHLSKLDEQNALVRTQNQLLIAMVSKGGNQGTVAQPIVMSNAMSDDDLMAQITRMKRNNYPV